MKYLYQPLCKFPLDREAYRAYNTPGSLYPVPNKKRHEVGAHPAPCEFLFWPGIKFLAEKIGRQLTVEDLKKLLKYDGIRLCCVSGQRFQALSWSVLDRGFIDRCQSEEAVFGRLLRLGPFFFGNTDFSLVLAFSGSLARAMRDINANVSAEKMCPLGQAFRSCNNSWGFAWLDAINISREHERRAKEKLVLTEGLTHMSDHLDHLDQAMDRATATGA